MLFIGPYPKLWRQNPQVAVLVAVLVAISFGHWANVDSMLVHAMVKVAVLATMYYIYYVLECKGWLASSGGWKGMTLK